MAIGQLAAGKNPLPGHRRRAPEAEQEPTEEDELRARLQQLTSRENEILGLLMEGNTVSEIARLNVVSEATVRTQVRSILTKLEVSSQLAAVGVAHRAGWPRQPTSEGRLRSLHCLAGHSWPVRALIRRRARARSRGSSPVRAS